MNFLRPTLTIDDQRGKTFFMSLKIGSIARRLLFLGLAALALTAALPASAQVVIYRFEIETDRDFNRDSYDGGYLVAPFNGGAASLIFTLDGAKTYTETASTGNMFTAVTDKKEIQWVVTATAGGTTTTDADGNSTTTGTDTYLAFGPADSSASFHTLTADITSLIAKEMKGRAVGASNAVSTNHPGRIGSAAVLDWRLKFDKNLSNRSNKAGHTVAESIQDVKDQLFKDGYLPEGVLNLSVATASLAGGGAGTAYSQSLVSSGGSGTVTWAIVGGSLPPGLSLSGATISGTPTTSGTFSFTVRATDGSSPAQTATRTLSILISQISIPTNPAPATATNGTAYTTTLAALHGISPLTWTLGPSPATLPLGLALNSSTGVISGTPIGANTTDFNVTVTDSSDTPKSATSTLTIKVTLVILTPATLPDATVGAAYAEALTAEGGKLPIVWSLKAGSTLPAGITLTGSTLSGTPTTAGVNTFTLVVTDVAGVTSEREFTLTVN